MKKLNKKGFTLVELLAVIVILALLIIVVATTALPAMNNAKKSGYIALKKDVYTILPGGEFLIEQLSKMNISMDKYKTSELGVALKSVYRGKMSVNESVELARAEISKVFGKKEITVETDEDTGFYGERIGTCPVCGKEVIRGKFNYGCMGYKEGCTFKISFYICEQIKK